MTAREHYICFDRTMEGRRGMSVSEWTYFLDNYEEVIDHGIQIFGGEKPLPPWTVTWTRAGEGTAFAFEIIIRARQASSHAR